MNNYFIDQITQKPIRIIIGNKAYIKSLPVPVQSQTCRDYAMGEPNVCSARNFRHATVTTGVHREVGGERGRRHGHWAKGLDVRLSLCAGNGIAG